MVNLRSRSKARAVAPGASLKTEPTIPTSSTPSDDVDLSEAALRKLPRAKLQKLAMAHKVKANTKSELIIRQLSSLQIPKRTRATEDGPEEGPSRKRLRREVGSEEVAISRTPENQVTHLDTPSTRDTPVQTSVEDPQPAAAGPSVPRPMSPAHKTPTRLSYDENLFSGTESEGTEEEQLDFTTPVSSRSGTPPPANTKDLDRCVKIMQEISAQDVALLNEVTDVRENAAKLRKRARDIRELVKAETGRRERMEAYFRYWQEIEPTWDRRWLYGEKMVPDHKIRLKESDKPAGPPTIPRGQHLGGHARPATPVPAQKPMLSPEQLKQKREAIISKQEAQQRELEALRIREMLDENFSGGWSSEAADVTVGEGSSKLTNLPSATDDVNEALMISFENGIGTITAPAPSP